jgi:hypothetical protein
MVVMARESWTDERLDDLKVGVDSRFDRVDADIRELRSETKKGFERVDDRFDAVQRSMTTWAIALFSAIVTLNGAVIAVIALT